MDRGQALKDFNMKYNVELFEFVRMGWDALETNGALPFERSRSDEEFSIGNTRKEGDRMVRLLGTTVDGAEDGEKNNEWESYFRDCLSRDGSYYTAIESR